MMPMNPDMKARNSTRTKLTREIINHRLLKRGIILVGDFTSSHSKTGFQCPEGHLWSATPANVLYGFGCPYCSGNARLTKTSINIKLAPRGIVMLDEYVNQKVKSTFQCKKGHVWKTHAGSVIYANGCPTCAQENAGEKTRLATKTIDKRLAIRNIKIIGPYKNANTKSQFQCKDGHIWTATPGSVMAGNGCPVCAKNLPLTLEVIEKRLALRGISLAEEYKGGRFKTLFRCKIGHTWKTTASGVTAINGSGCPECEGQTPLSKDIVNLRIANRGYVMLGEYKNADTKALFKCSEGHSWETTPYHISRKERPTGCPHCSRMAPLTTAQVNSRIKDRGLILMDDFVTNTKKVRFRCTQGHIWEAKPNNILNGRGCPECAESVCDDDAFYLWVAQSQKIIEVNQDEFLVKFGRTSARLKKKRIQEVAAKWKAKPLILALIKTKEPAVNIEKQAFKFGRMLSKEFSKLDGYTEFRIVNKNELFILISLAEKFSEQKIIWDNSIIHESGLIHKLNSCFTKI